MSNNFMQVKFIAAIGSNQIMIMVRDKETLKAQFAHTYIYGIDLIDDGIGEEYANDVLAKICEMYEVKKSDIVYSGKTEISNTAWTQKEARRHADLVWEGRDF